MSVSIFLSQVSHNSLALACSFKRDFNHVCCVTFVEKRYYFLNQTLVNFVQKSKGSLRYCKVSPVQLADCDFSGWCYKYTINCLDV